MMTANYTYYIYLDANHTPINLPHHRENLSQTTTIDFNNLPGNIAPFEFIEEQIGVYQVLANNDEVFVLESDGVVRNRKVIRDMTSEEKAAKIADAKASKHAETPDSWVFNENICAFYPPNGYPADFDEAAYWWVESSQSWELTPEATDEDGNVVPDLRTIKPE